jgi:hypothetical protein
MRTVPKKIDLKVKERCVRLVLEHLQEDLSLTAIAIARHPNADKARS